jgi:hypothetical protein
MRIPLLFAALGVICLPLLGTAPAHAQASRTFVSGVGNDANPCSRTAPCKTFAGAISKTAAGGEIDCLDPAGYGAVTITKSITIDCTPTLGSVLSALTNGINVNGVGIIVNLRGVVVNGIGTGLIGINFIAGAALNLDRVTVMNINSGSATGVLFAPNSLNAVLTVNDCYFESNGIAPATGGGLVVQPAVGGSAAVVVSNSRFSNNSDSVKATSTNGVITMTVRDSVMADGRGSGVNASAGSTINLMIDRATISNNFQNGVRSSGGNSLVRIQSSTITGNATGVLSAAGGVLHSYKNNAINGNGVDGTPITQELAN